MAERSTEGLVRELVRGLRPVRALPPLRVAAAGVLLVWLAAVALHWGLGGPLPRLGDRSGFGDPVYAVIFAGLVIAAGGGVVAALARAVPGREAVARVGAIALATGLVLCVGAALLGALAGPRAAGVGEGAWCSGRAVLLALAPGGVILAFVTRGFERSPGPGSLALALAALSLGAIAVHASCVTGDGLHVLLAHVAAPVALAALLAPPMALWLRSRSAAASS